MIRKLASPIWLILGSSLIAVACASKHDDAPTVIDLHASCTQRAAWKNVGASECSNCNARAALNCNCTHVGYEGLCETENKAKVAETSCTPDLSACVGACTGDCACEDKCYASSPKCGAVTTDLNSCLARICDSYCK